MSKFEICSDYEKFKAVFLEQNSKLNLVSKNDEKLLYEKHFYDSLSIKLFFEKYNYKPETILDIGTGGGFPSVPIAFEFKDISVVGIDSIRKKIAAVQSISDNLGLTNLSLINDRVENIKGESFDLITSRAVAKIDILVKYAYPLLNKGGYMVFYKSKSVNEELDEAINTIRSYGLKILPAIEYDLPLEDVYKRTLVIFKRVK